MATLTAALNLTSSFSTSFYMPLELITLLTPTREAIQILTPESLRVPAVTSCGPQAVVPVSRFYNLKHYLYKALFSHPDPTLNVLKYKTPALSSSYMLPWFFTEKILRNV